MSDQIVLGPGEGESIPFVGNVGVVKADREATGGWGVVEISAPAGYETPLHVHDKEDEAFYVLEGNLTITIGEESFPAPTGSFVLSPKGVSHKIRIESETRWLLIATSGLFVEMIREVGAPQAVGAPGFREAAAKHGVTFLGP